MGEVDLFSNSSLGASSVIFGSSSVPIANTKYDSAAADQSSRQADTRHEPAAAVQFSQQADTRQLQFNPEETARLDNQPEARQQKWQAATGASRAVLGRVSVNGSVITMLRM